MMVINFLAATCIAGLIFWIMSLKEDISQLKLYKRYDEVGINVRNKLIEEWKDSSNSYKKEVEHYREEVHRLEDDNLDLRAQVQALADIIDNYRNELGAKELELNHYKNQLIKKSK